MKNSYFTPLRETLSQNAAYTVSITHALIWGSLQQKGLVKVSALLSSSFRISSRFCVSTNQSVAFGPTGMLVVFLHLFNPSANSQVQMLESVMSLVPICQRESEQHQPYLQRGNRVCQECGTHVLRNLDTILQTYKLDRGTFYPGSGGKGTKRNSHFRRSHGRFHSLSGADLAAKSHHCTPWPPSSISPP